MSEVNKFTGNVGPTLQDLLFFFGIISLAFGDIPYLYHYLGGFSMQGGAYFFTPAAVVLMMLFIAGRRIHVPIFGAGRILFIFLLWVAMSTLVNFGDVIDANKFGRSGITQLLRQSTVILVGFATTIFVYNRYRRARSRGVIEMGVILSAALALPVAFLQFLAQIHVPLTEEISIAIGAIFRTDLVSGAVRVAGFKPEPSVFAIWVSFIFPYLAAAWIVPLKYRRIRQLLAIVAILLVFVSGSRTAIGICVAQLSVIFFLVIMYGNKLMRHKVKSLAIILLGGLMSVAITLPSFLGDMPEHIDFNIYSQLKGIFTVGVESGNGASDHIESNSLRLGGQVANVMIGFENVIFGVGFSQSPYYISSHLPYWAEIWSDLRDPFTGLGTHSRIFAEMGAVGLIIWMLFWFTLFLSLLKQCEQKCKTEFIVEPMILLTIGIGLFLGCFSHDSFAYFEYWVYIGLALAQANTVIKNGPNFRTAPLGAISQTDKSTGKHFVHLKSNVVV